MTAQILYRSAAPAAEIVFDAPARRNAFNMEMWAALPELVDRAEQDKVVRVVILHGGETGHFAAGADISEFETIYADRDVAARTARTIADGLNALAACSKPVIAAIEGVCIGGGVSVALAADIRIASEDARFGVTPARLGLVYPGDDTRRLIEAVGASQAKDILFTGDIFDAARAERIGLVDELCGPGSAVETARSKAETIAQRSQTSVRLAKQMVDAISSPDGLSTADAESLFLEGVSGADFAEGYRAFLQKRDPDFPNR